MYYDVRQNTLYFGGEYGSLHREVNYANGQNYVSDTGNSPGNQIYTRLSEDRIVDYRETRGGRHTSSSSKFSQKYAQMFKPVDHYWRWIKIHPTVGHTAMWYIGSTQYVFEHSGNLTDDINYWGQPEFILEKYNVLPYSVKNGYTSGSHLSWDQMISRGLDSIPDMLNDNKLLNLEQVDVATFLAELRDIRTLADMVKFNKHHTDVSNKYLGFNFGVLPLVSDIAKMYENAENLTPALKSWNDMVDSNNVRAYHRTLHNAEEKGVYTYKPGDKGGNINFSYEYDYHWTQSYKEVAHSYVRPKSMASSTDISLQASLWGLDQPLRTVWNLIPMSFAVDWVVNVGDIIADFEHREPSLDFDIIGTGISGKLETSIITKTYVVRNGERTYVGESQVESSHYVRVPVPTEDVFSYLQDMPIGPLEFNTSFSGKQIALSAALVHQKIFKF